MKKLDFSADLFREIVDGPPNPSPEDFVAFDATGFAPSAWPNSLKPIGAGTVQCESFATWWERHKTTLAHLHPMIAEQWIYKHWIWSPYRNVPLDHLVWQQESWRTRRILDEFFVRPQFGKLKPAFDYDVFHGKFFEPGRTMDRTGTLLSDPGSFNSEWREDDAAPVRTGAVLPHRGTSAGTLPQRFELPRQMRG